MKDRRRQRHFGAGGRSVPPFADACRPSTSIASVPGSCLMSPFGISATVAATALPSGVSALCALPSCAASLARQQAVRVMLTRPAGE